MQEECKGLHTGLPVRVEVESITTRELRPSFLMA